MIAGSLSAACLVLLFSDEFNSFRRDRNVTEAEMAESAALRPLLATVAWDMFADRPLWGHGFGQYTQAKRLYHQTPTEAPLKKVLPYMQHNVILSYLTETGLAGTLPLVGVLVLGWSAARRLQQRRRAAEEVAVGWLGMACVAAYLVNGMFHDVSIIPMIGSLQMLLLGLVENVRTAAMSEGAALAAEAVERPQPDRLRLAS